MKMMQKKEYKANRLISTIFRMMNLLVIIVLLLGCNSGRNNQNLNNLKANENTHWIGNDKSLPEKDALFYLDDPAPLFRKEIDVNGQLESAKLLITAAGYYRATINGQRIGQNRLDPAWTDFRKRIYYSEYDITNFLNSEKNCIGVTLGNGFYNPLPLKKWVRRNLRDVLKTGRPVFIRKIVLEYQNGLKE
jgi:alpha-L-rhamnosidase